jgi:hypothetical protein
MKRYTSVHVESKIEKKNQVSTAQQIQITSCGYIFFFLKFINLNGTFIKSFIFLHTFSYLHFYAIVQLHKVFIYNLMGMLVQKVHMKSVFSAISFFLLRKGNLIGHDTSLVYNFLDDTII